MSGESASPGAGYLCYFCALHVTTATAPTVQLQCHSSKAHLICMTLLLPVRVHVPALPGRTSCAPSTQPTATVLLVCNLHQLSNMLQGEA